MIALKKKQIPGEVKPAGGVRHGLGFAVLLDSLRELVELFRVDSLGVALPLLGGHEAQGQEAGHEEEGVHDETRSGVR